jgi:hypothetical protein
MNEQRKKYQQAYNARKFTCVTECGAVYTYGRKQAHLRSKLHAKKLNIKAGTFVSHKMAKHVCECGGRFTGKNKILMATQREQNPC